MPVVDTREKYAENKNYQIEFCFLDKYLLKKIKNMGLILEFPEVVQQIPKLGLRLQSVQSTELYFRTVVSGSKKHFAEKVVPTLPDEAFSNFEIVFNEFDKVLKEIKKRRKQQSSEGSIKK